jgi:hypothetical protein
MEIINTNINIILGARLLWSVGTDLIIAGHPPRSLIHWFGMWTSVPQKMEVSSLHIKEQTRDKIELFHRILK